MRLIMECFYFCFFCLQVARGGANKWGSLLAAVYGRAFQWAHNETRSRPGVDISFRHFRIEEGIEAEICPAIVSEIVTEDAPMRYTPLPHFP